MAVAVLGCLSLPGAVSGYENAAPEMWSVHGQTTVVEQWHGDFTSPYEGLNSLNPTTEDKHTATLTLFLGRRLWSGGELYYNPEFTQGTGLSQSVGVAGFPNGEATRAGSETPQYNTARLFLRQTFGLGGAASPVEPDKNQLGGPGEDNALVFTVGKFAASDIFDANVYSHDPRTQFLNWSLMENGAWDYPADVKGYTGGFTVEWVQSTRTLRWGALMEPKVANERILDTHLRSAVSQAAEWEERYKLASRAGVLRGLIYWNRAHMGNYEDAIRAAPGAAPDITTTRSYRSKVGAGLNWEQAVTETFGVFARAGWNDGRTESWAFTEIDRTLSGGVSLKGATWSRPADTFGLAGVVNGLSSEHRRYLAAGGYGFIVGDGRLAYAPEEILETYYNWKACEWLGFAADYQYITNPGYNTARGPVSVFAVRMHAEF